MLLLLVCLTFIVTTAGYGLLLWLACRRIAQHIKGNEAAIKALTEHLFLPLFGTNEAAATETEEEEAAVGDSPKIL